MRYVELCLLLLIIMSFGFTDVNSICTTPVAITGQAFVDGDLLSSGSIEIVGQNTDSIKNGTYYIMPTINKTSGNETFILKIYANGTYLGTTNVSLSCNGGSKNVDIRIYRNTGSNNGNYTNGSNNNATNNTNISNNTNNNSNISVALSNSTPASDNSQTQNTVQTIVSSTADDTSIQNPPSIPTTSSDNSQTQDNTQGTASSTTDNTSIQNHTPSIPTTSSSNSQTQDNTQGTASSTTDNTSIQKPPSIPNITPNPTQTRDNITPSDNISMDDIKNKSQETNSSGLNFDSSTLYFFLIVVALLFVILIFLWKRSNKKI